MEDYIRKLHSFGCSTHCKSVPEEVGLLACWLQHNHELKDNSYRFSESENLPLNFDLELFKAVDNFVRAKESQSDTDPETEAEADLSEVIAQLGCKRGRRRSMLVRRCAEEKFLKSYLQEKSQKTISVKEFCDNHVEEKPQKVLARKKPRKSGTKVKSRKKGVEGKMGSSIEDRANNGGKIA